MDTPENFIVFFSPEKLARFSKPLSWAQNDKISSHLIVDITFFRHIDILAKTRSRMTKATAFSRQNDAGSRARTT